MVLLSSHFPEILLKILLWWTALCTWKYVPTKQSGVRKDSRLSVWQSTSPCSHFPPGSTAVKKWLWPRCASRGVCPAWCTSSWEQGSPGDGARWQLSPPAVSVGPGREREREEPLPQAGTALPPCSERRPERLREPQACHSVPGGMKGSLPAAFSLEGWPEGIAGLFSCCFSPLGGKDGGRQLLARSRAWLWPARVVPFQVLQLPQLTAGMVKNSWRNGASEVTLLGIVLLASGGRSGCGKYNGDVNSIRPNRSDARRQWLPSPNRYMGREKSKLVEQTSGRVWGQTEHERSWFLENRKRCPHRTVSPTSVARGMWRRVRDSQPAAREGSGAQLPLPTPHPHSWESQRKSPSCTLHFLSFLCAASVKSGKDSRSLPHFNSRARYLLHLKAGAGVG